MRDWLGALALPEEKRSDCAACPQACGAADLSQHPWRFHEETRCCTYHPALPNWLVGRILAAGGAGAALIRARLQDREGVHAEGIFASMERLNLQKRLGEAGFGRSPEIRCPYWVGGELTCGIWENRNAVCRTWFCKTADGPRSTAMWRHLETLMRGLESRLQKLCMEQGTPPPADAPVEDLCDWYQQCAEVVAGLTVADLDDPQLVALRDEFPMLLEVLSQPLPPLLGAAISDMRAVDGGIEMRGYSRWDQLVVPMGIFRLLGRLTGEMGWREALQLANSELPEPIPESLVEEMYRRGLLQELSGPEDLEAGAGRFGHGKQAHPSWMNELPTGQ